MACRRAIAPVCSPSWVSVHHATRVSIHRACSRTCKERMWRYKSFIKCGPRRRGSVVHESSIITGHHLRATVIAASTPLHGTDPVKRRIEHEGATFRVEGKQLGVLPPSIALYGDTGRERCIASVEKDGCHYPLPFSRTCDVHPCRTPTGMNPPHCRALHKPFPSAQGATGRGVNQPIREHNRDALQDGWWA